MAQAEIILSTATLVGLVTIIADVLRTVFSNYFVDIKCSCLVKCHCGVPLVVQWFDAWPICIKTDFFYLQIFVKPALGLIHG